MVMLNIKFSHNWNNKLSGSVFTTIRGSTQSKLEYYNENKGRLFDVRLKGFSMGKAALINLQQHKLSSLPAGLLMVDTGKDSLAGAMSVFGNFGLKSYSQVLVLTFAMEKHF